jgi:hypothetical protein
VTAPYLRPEGAKVQDLAAAREYELQVADVLPHWRIDETRATDRLDFWVPGFFVEVKEKRQRLTDRWQLLPNHPERDLFVMDELTVRRALRHWPYVYFVIRDVPGDRVFIASIAELIAVERVRRNRSGKGKWILDMTQFRRLPSLDQLTEFVMADLVDMPWKASHCLSPVDTIPQV